MKKLKLNVEAIKIESFRTDAPESTQGTVEAHEPTLALSCRCGTINLTCPYTCGPYLSCEIVC